MSATYDVFLSHNSADKPAVELIALRLRDGAGLRPFLDKWHLVPGAPWIPALERAIENSATVVVFFGPAGVSGWHDEEKQLALDLVHRARQGGRRVIPVLLPGGRKEDVEGFLRLRTWVDLTSDDGFIRLVAGITGQAPELLAGMEPGPSLRQRLAELSSRATEDSRSTQPTSSPSWNVDNRGAVVTQQINVFGTATFGGTSIGEAGGTGQSSVQVVVDPFAKVRREIIDFSTERGRHKHFFGREDVLTEMNAWVAERDTGWLLVTGSPGLGKSALFERWLRGREQRGLHTAFHFIRRGHLDWAEPQVVQRNLAAQIEMMFPDQRDPDVDPVYRLEQLLGRMGLLLAEWDERLVLLVDGLDEAMSLGTASKDNPIPKIFPLELPDRVFVVAASRPRYPHLSWLEQRGGPFEKIALDERIESNDRAVQAYWTSLGPTMTPPPTDDLVHAAVRGAEGNLLHAVKLRELWNKPGVERKAKAVPRGFPAMVDELWQRIGELPKAPRKLVRDGLALVCAARDSLPLRVIEELLGWDEDQAWDEFLPLAREMLLEEPWGKVPAYRPFHESLRELVERRQDERNEESIRTYHQVLAEYALWPVEGDGFRRSYSLRHRVLHRVEARNLEAAALACMDLDFLTAKACAEGMHTVERDIRLAAEVRVPDEVRERLTLLGRLIAAISHWAREVPQALPALLHDRALTNGPEILGALVGLDHTLREHPRLRHPLQIRGMSRILQGQQGSVKALAVLLDGRVVSGSEDKTVYVWDVDAGRTVAVLEGHESDVNALAVLPDGRIVSGSSDKTLRIWDVETGRAATTLQGPAGWVNALAVLPDGRVVSGSFDKMLRVWDIQTGRAVATLQGHNALVNALAVLPDGRVVSGSFDRTLRVWDVQTGRAVATFQDHHGVVNALAVLPDGRVVSGTGDNTLRVWDVQTGRAVATLEGHQGEVNALAILPDGRVVSSSGDGMLRVWDVEMGRTVATSHDSPGWVKALVVLPDGGVVSGSDDGALRVWDVETGRTLATLQGPPGWVNALAVLPDGRVVSGSHDKTLRVWDVETGRILATVYGDAAFLSVVCIDQHLIVAGDGAGNVWFIDLPELPRA